MELIEAIKQNEGFIGTVYKDTLGFDTIGYGTKLPLNEDEAELILNYRLNKFIDRITKKKPILKELDEVRQNVIYEMVYQMGVSGVLKFKNMWHHIEQGDFKNASIQMLNSRWSLQTPNRAKALSKKMLEGK